MLLFPLFLWGQEKVSKNIQKFPAKEITILQNDSWFGRDKAKHFVASFLIAGAGSWWTRHRCGRGRGESVRFGMGFALSLGVVKEFCDGRSPRGRFSWKDVAADLLGVSLGGLLLGGW